MLTEICGHLRNWFEKEIRIGTFAISSGSISLDFLQDGQYFRIVGSVFNDGVYQYPAANLTDEEFRGAVWAMAIPPEFLALCREISDYQESDAGKATPYTSESFGGYSYTIAGGSGGNSAASAKAWENVFRDRLNRWRKI